MSTSIVARMGQAFLEDISTYGLNYRYQIVNLIVWAMQKGKLASLKYRTDLETPMHLWKRYIIPIKM